MRLVDTIGQSCGSRFVHDTLYFQTGNLTGFLRSLTLRVAEIRRYGIYDATTVDEWSENNNDNS